MKLLINPIAAIANKHRILTINNILIKGIINNGRIPITNKGKPINNSMNITLKANSKYTCIVTNIVIFFICPMILVLKSYYVFIGSGESWFFIRTYKRFISCCS